jgi:hypothetical protein
MPITADPGTFFEAVISGLPTGQYGTLTVAVYDGEGNIVIAPHVTGIVEQPAGTYTAKMVTPVVPGTYNVTWVLGADSYTEQLSVTMGGGPEPWLPSVEDVAMWVRARTKTDTGTEAGTFTPDTRPTNLDVERLILLMAASLPSCVGPWLPESLYNKSRFVLALKTAMAVEITFFPEQLDPKQSAYEYLSLWLDREQAGLCTLAEDYIPDDGSVPIATGDLPRFQFGDGTYFVWDEVFKPVTETTVVFADRPIGWVGF